MLKPNYRLRELDFLRGIAILLVLARHQPFNQYLEQLGWIGVDLFFVLSGFLVSGLLFREYIVSKTIKPLRFLIRRGFKIYPIYYLSFIIYLIPAFQKTQFRSFDLISELTFTQNYFLGFGFYNPPDWSLAIEEHFYFGIASLFFIGFKTGVIDFHKIKSSKRFLISILIIMTLCFGLRILSNLLWPHEISRNFTMTHLRIDSLLAGVCISYFYHFRFDVLKIMFKKYKTIWISLAIIGLSWTPFTVALDSFIAKTIGFTFLYISFGVILSAFLLIPEINLILDKIFSRKVTNFISKIGYCSYSIYIIHSFVNMEFGYFKINEFYNDISFITFILTTSLSIAFGFFLTYTIEKYFLDVRNRIYPAVKN